MKGDRYELAVYDENAVNGWCILDLHKPCHTCRLKYESVLIGNKTLCEIVLRTLNSLADENKKLEKQIEELLYQIGEVGKNNKTCKDCISYEDDIKYCTMYDMEVEAEDIVVACDERENKLAEVNKMIEKGGVLK